MTTSFLTMSEVADRLGLARSTVGRWVQNGKLVVQVYGKRKIVPLDALFTFSFLEPESLPPSDLGKLGIPFPPNWDKELTFHDVERIAASVTAVLRRGGALLESDCLAPFIRGKQIPGTLFWRYLQRGIEQIKDTHPPWVPSDGQIEQIKAMAKEKGIGFSAAAFILETQLMAAELEFQAAVNRDKDEAKADPAWDDLCRSRGPISNSSTGVKN